MVSPAQSLRDQWKEPSDIFTVLLIIGGDIVQQALGAVSGGFLTPVAFSYGWVAYAVSALLSATGDGRLMPETPITNLRVINLKSGYCRWNRSWVLGRVFQDYEHWMPSAVRERLEEHPSQNSDEEKKVPGLLPGGRQPEVALCVAVYHWSTGRNSLARPGHDWVWWTGLLVSLIQTAISAVPFGIYGDWRVFLVTVSGTVLAYAAGALPGWRKEKWACRRGSGKDVALTLGNGSTHVVIVHGGHPDGLDLEDLAGAQVRHSGAATSNRRSISRMIESCNTTRFFITFLAILWLVLLITSQAIESHTWYLVGVGGLGMIQNLIVAGAPRFPEMLGISIELSESSQGTPSVFAEYKVMYTLMELELGYKGFGRALLAEFFPGKLRDWEEKWWALTDNEERRVILDQKKRGLQR